MAAWTTKTIAERFKDAALILKALPASRVQEQSSLFFQVIKSLNESTLSKSDLVQLFKTSDTVAKLQETFKWNSYLDDQSRELIWKRASGVSWKTIMKELGCSRVTAWRLWQEALGKLNKHLNSDNKGT